MALCTATERIFSMVEKELACSFDVTKRYRGLLIVCLVLFSYLLTSFSSGPQATGVPHEVRPDTKSSPMRAPDSIAPSGAYEGVSDYRIGPNDLLDISVFGVDTLSRTVRVNSVGMNGLPLIGSVHA